MKLLTLFADVEVSLSSEMSFPSNTHVHTSQNFQGILFSEEEKTALENSTSSHTEFWNAGKTTFLLAPGALFEPGYEAQSVYAQKKNMCNLEEN